LILVTPRHDFLPFSLVPAGSLCEICIADPHCSDLMHCIDDVLNTENISKKNIINAMHEV